MKKLGVLISGTGSNMKAIINACKQGVLNAEVSVVVSNKADAGGIEYATQAGIKTSVVDHRQYINREEFEKQIDIILKQHMVELVCLAGFMRLLSPYLINSWAGRMINIHPSLLPAFKGINAQQQAYDYGVKITGCTVHHVTEEMDAGPIIEQTAVEVRESDTLQTLSARILEAEHATYIRALQKLCS